MMLGKRPRPPMRRTTSMSGITVDFAGVEAPAPSDPPQNPPIIAEREEKERCDQSLLSMVSPRLSHRRNSWSDRISETADFLRTCGLCNRRLVPARDIYMYRGDAAFCSVECREQRMKHDETKNGNCSAAAGAATSKITPTKHGVTSSHSPAM